MLWLFVRSGLRPLSCSDSLRPSSRRRQIHCLVMQMNWTYTAGRRALHVKNTPGHPSVPLPTPHPLPCLSLTLQEGGWVREDEEAAVNRGKSKPSTRIRCLSALGCAVAQLSGQTATDSCYQLELLEPHSLRHLSSAAVLYTCELASLPGYC